MPTMAFAGGDPLPAGMTIDGCNLLPAMTKRGRVERADPPLFWNSGYYKVVRAGNWKLPCSDDEDCKAGLPRPGYCYRNC